MNEYLENIGRRMELRRKRLRLHTECEALRDRLRRFLPPDEEVADLDREGILRAALAFSQHVEELLGLDKKLAALERILGG